MTFIFITRIADLIKERAVVKNFLYDTYITEISKIKSKKFKDYCKTELNKFENNLKDKLKTTPDPGINRISKVFRIDWSKVFKRGWLLWK